jgi:hypothetical protein
LLSVQRISSTKTKKIFPKIRLIIRHQKRRGTFVSSLKIAKLRKFSQNFNIQSKLTIEIQKIYIGAKKFHAVVPLTQKAYSILARFLYCILSHNLGEQTLLYPAGSGVAKVNNNKK